MWLPPPGLTEHAIEAATRPAHSPTTESTRAYTATDFIATDRAVLPRILRPQGCADCPHPSRGRGSLSGEGRCLSTLSSPQLIENCGPHSLAWNRWDRGINGACSQNVSDTRDAPGDRITDFVDGPMPLRLSRLVPTVTSAHHPKRVGIYPCLHSAHHRGSPCILRVAWSHWRVRRHEVDQAVWSAAWSTTVTGTSQ